MEQQNELFSLRNSPGHSLRMTISLPEDLAVGINRLAKRMGISKSSLVTALLSQAIPDLENLFAGVEDNSAETQKRLRGDSIDLIFKRVSDAMREI